MNLIDRVSRQFEDNMRTALESLELLAAPLAGAAELITASLLDNGKVLVCGGPGTAAAVKRFAAQLVHGFELERPSLAALALTSDARPLGGAAAIEGELARQVAVFGHPGDILVALCADGDPAGVTEAVIAARERDIRVIALTGSNDGGIAPHLAPTDIHLSVPSARPARVSELHLLALHCLCDSIDCLLLGVEE